MAEVHPFARIPRGREIYGEIQAISEKTLARRLSIGKTIIHERKAKVLQKLARMLGIQLEARQAAEAHKLTGVSDVKLPRSSLAYGAATAAELQLSLQNKVLAALFIARAHHAAVGVYGKPRSLRRLKLKIRKITVSKKNEELALGNIYNAVADHRVGLFLERFKHMDGYGIFDSRYEDLSRFIMGGQHIPDSIANGELRVKKLLEETEKT